MQVNLISDTVTRPSQGMLEQMMNASVGDDVWEEDFTVKELDEILEKYGELRKIPVEHSVYNKLIGIASKKRQKKNTKVEEFLWLLKKNNE